MQVLTMRPTMTDAKSTAMTLHLDEPDLIAWIHLNQPLGFSLGETCKAIAAAQARAELDGLALGAGAMPADLLATLVDLRRVLDRLGIKL